jgi:hypothetical protein
VIAVAAVFEIAIAIIAIVILPMLARSGSFILVAQDIGPYQLFLPQGLIVIVVMISHVVPGLRWLVQILFGNVIIIIAIVMCDKGDSCISSDICILILVDTRIRLIKVHGTFAFACATTILLVI